MGGVMFGARRKALAEAFGVSVAAIKAVLSNRNWRVEA